MSSDIGTKKIVWRRTTTDPVTNDRRVAVHSDELGIDAWARVRWVAGHARLGVVENYDGAAIDLDPEFA